MDYIKPGEITDAISMCDKGVSYINGDEVGYTIIDGAFDMERVARILNRLVTRRVAKDLTS